MPVNFELHDTISTQWDNGMYFLGCQSIPDRVTVIPLVSDEDFRLWSRLGHNGVKALHIRDFVWR